MDCPSCGADNIDSATFCSLCLTKFASPAEPDDAPEPRSESRDAMPEVVARRHIAEAQAAVGENELLRAEQCYRAALDTYAAAGIERGQDYEIAVFQLAQVLQAAERPDEAIPFFQRNVEMVVTRMGENSPALVSEYQALGDAFMAARRSDEAAHAFYRATQVARSPENRIESCLRLAKAYRTLGQFEHAEATIAAADQIVEAEFGKASEWGCRVMNTLADLRGEQGRFDEADAILIEAETTARRLPLRSSHLLPMLLAHRATLATQTGRDEDSDAFLAEARSLLA